MDSSKKLDKGVGPLFGYSFRPDGNGSLFGTWPSQNLVQYHGGCFHKYRQSPFGRKKSIIILNNTSKYKNVTH